MHIHILGICGTFMGSIAQLAKAHGCRVTGCDANVYPPMSNQLEQAGIELIEGFGLEQLALAPDLFVIGNAMSRGNPLVEAILDRGLPYTSGPQWLSETILRDKWVLAVAGTHGKTTTSSMLAWILEDCGYNPSYLIGGVPTNFKTSARLTDSTFFVTEADEYDTAFFDKRSKFVHYRSRTLILNNLEFDHADIFPDLAAIETQFHHLVRTIPSQGQIIHPANDESLNRVLARGCWTPTAAIGLSGDVAPWRAELIAPDGSQFDVLLEGTSGGRITWDLTGLHNVNNGLAAIAAARHVGVTLEKAIAALNKFSGVKRRMECLGKPNDISVYDDFAHHPTAIASTLAGLREKVGQESIIAVIEPRSNTMRMGTHKQKLAAATAAADIVIWYQPENVDWDLGAVVNSSDGKAMLARSIEQIVSEVAGTATPGSHVVIMSNGSFGGVHKQILERLG